MADGEPEKMCELFLRPSHEIALEHGTRRVRASAFFDAVAFLSVEVLATDGLATDELESGGTLRVRIRCELNAFLEKPEIVVDTHTTRLRHLPPRHTSSPTTRLISCPVLTS